MAQLKKKLKKSFLIHPAVLPQAVEGVMTPSVLHALIDLQQLPARAYQHKQHAHCIFPISQLHLEECQLKKIATMLDYDTV